VISADSYGTPVWRKRTRDRYGDVLVLLVEF
jgi:hypothetical protein